MSYALNISSLAMSFSPWLWRSFDSSPEEDGADWLAEVALLSPQAEATASIWCLLKMFAFVLWAYEAVFSPAGCALLVGWLVRFFLQTGDLCSQHHRWCQGHEHEFQYQQNNGEEDYFFWYCFAVCLFLLFSCSERSLSHYVVFISLFSLTARDLNLVHYFIFLSKAEKDL